MGALSRRLEAWLRAHREGLAPLAPLAPITEPDLAQVPVAYVDWSAASSELGSPADLADVGAWSESLFARLAARGARGGVGGYDEARPVYASEAYRRRGPQRDEWRSVHLGLDFFLEAGAPVFAPLAGVVHSFADNAAPFDYGPCIVLEHRLEDDSGPLLFHTLYGHLSRESLRGFEVTLEVGREIAAGERIAELGDATVNGGWPPHLHLQIVLDMLGARGDFFGSCRPSERPFWLALCPDPSLLTRIPEAVFPPRDAAFEARRRGGEPLPIVRGWEAERWDEDGQRFLALDAPEAEANRVPLPVRSALLTGLRGLAGRVAFPGAIAETSSGCHIELVGAHSDAARFRRRLRDRGLLVAADPADARAVALRPALGFTLAQVATVVATFEFVLGEAVRDAVVSAGGGSGTLRPT